MTVYEVCADMIDVLADFEGIYSPGPPEVRETTGIPLIEERPENVAGSVMKLENDRMIYHHLVSKYVTPFSFLLGVEDGVADACVWGVLGVWHWYV